MQVVGQPGSALHQELQHAALPQVAEHLGQVAGQLDRGLHSGVGRGRAQHHPQRLHEPVGQLLGG